MSDVMKLGRRERKKLERRDEILGCATDLFNRHGFEGVSVEAIAEAADVSLRTLYNFFPTKLDLLVASYIQSLRERLESAFAHLENPAADPVDGLYAWAKAQFDLYDAVDRNILLRSALHGLAQGPQKGGGQDYAQLDFFAMAGVTKLLDIYNARGSLSPDLDAAAAGRLIIAAGNGEFFFWIADPEANVETTLAYMRSHIELALAAGMRPAAAVKTSAKASKKPSRPLKHVR
jgi:AcrR family transcriptional regulator